MRLILPIPERCPRRDLDGDRTLVVLEGPEARPAITLTILHPRALPMSLLEWSNDVSLSDLLPGTASWDVSSSVVHTRGGWPLSLLHTELYRGKELQPVEIRLNALYHFTPFHSLYAAVVARVHDTARFEAARRWLVDLMQEAWPDWRGAEVAALAELYD